MAVTGQPRRECQMKYNFGEDRHKPSAKKGPRITLPGVRRSYRGLSEREINQFVSCIGTYRMRKIMQENPHNLPGERASTFYDSRRYRK